MNVVISSMADANRLATTGRTVQGVVALKDLTRLTGLLVEPFGSVNYKLVFSPDIVGRACVRVVLDGAARLLCQRSLEGFDFKIDSDTQLGFIATEEEESALMPGFDPILVDPAMIAQDAITPLGLVEDELILLIPPVPVNPALSNTESPGVWQARAPEKAHPFAALGSLLKTKPS